MKITYRVFDEIPEECVKIRTAVFMDEQGFCNEFDETDKKAKHIVLYVDGNPSGVGRFFTDDGAEYHIGRLAVLKEQRGLHLGSELIKSAEAEIIALGGKTAVLSAQYRAKGFYEKNGYTAHGDKYFDEHVEHINMKKQL